MAILSGSDLVVVNLEVPGPLVASLMGSGLAASPKGFALIEEVNTVIVVTAATVAATAEKTAGHTHQGCSVQVANQHRMY